MGYCYSPLELAIVNITNHLSVENYNSNFFTHGYAARGILHLKGTVTQAQLTSFRRQFYNTISGAQNAWRTPIIGGLDEVQWVPMSGSAKEMEYLNYNNHLMRSLCTQFQIDPIELGLDYLVSNGTRSGGQQQANNEYKINYSRERGLIPILMMFEDMINCSVLPALDHELAAKFEFKFTGYDEDSPQTQVAQLQAEMTVHSTMNDLLRAAGKETMKHVVGDLPLNQTFWMLVEKNMTKAEIRRDFFGDKKAMDKRELAYFPADPVFMGWQQLLLTMDRSRAQDKMQAEQMKAQQEAQEKQGALEEGQHQREQEAHDATMDQVKARQAHAAVAHESLKDSAKAFGAGSKALAGPDGGMIANPINSDTADET
jgi:phage portal protein BeeE